MFLDKHHILRKTLCCAIAFMLCISMNPSTALSAEELIGDGQLQEEVGLTAGSDDSSVDKDDPDHSPESILDENNITSEKQDQAAQNNEQQSESNEQLNDNSQSENTQQYLAASAQVQTYGWKTVDSTSLTSSVVLGTTGQGKRLEAFTLSIPGVEDGGIEYRAHVQSYGWMDWQSNGAMAGTENQAKRLEAAQIKLTGSLADKYDVYYRAHVQSYGWLGWAKNGESAGSEGLAKRVEAIEIVLLEKDTMPDDYDGASSSFYQAAISGSSQIQSVGWQTSASPFLDQSFTLGTLGQGKRLEAFTLSIPGVEDGGIEYRAHVQSYGWMDWQSNGAMAGTESQAKRLEAVQIKLTGSLADKYDVYYRAHISKVGWLGWAKNGESAGTQECKVPIEAIEIKLTPKEESAPGDTSLAFIEGSNLPVSASYAGLSRGSNAWIEAKPSATAGITGKSAPLLGIRLSASGNQISGGISYSAHFAKTGWTGTYGNGAEIKSGNAVQAIKINLTGGLSKYFDIYYRAHVSGYGWMGWAKNGAPAGSSGLGINMEAYQVVIVLKGSPAPGSTANAYSSANGFLKTFLQNRQYLQIANNYSSNTGYLILVDRAAHKVIVCSGSRGNWSVRYNWSCVTGAPNSPTITGSYYTTGYKKPSLSTDRRAIYCTQIWGEYFFHSILVSESELGQSLSHGCVRLSYPAALWIYNNIYVGTRVVIFN